MTLLDEKQRIVADRVADARVAYAAVIRRASQPEPQDVEVLAELMGVLRLTDAQVRSDIDAVMQPRDQRCP